MMTLFQYLKQFNNIVWYPSAYRDFMPIVNLSSKFLVDLGINKDETPDCYIFTDYLSYADYESNGRFFLDLDDKQTEVVLENDSRYKATIFNIKELKSLKIDFDPEMVAFDKDRYYGHVFIGDVLTEHPVHGKNVAKLIYVIVENTTFAFDFIIKNNIKVKYAIHNCYGHGFGCGRSNGRYMFHILKDLRVKYFISDMNEDYIGDDADKYLTYEQKKTIPILRNIYNYSTRNEWYGYDETKLYEIIDYRRSPAGWFNVRFTLEEEG